MVLHCPVLGVWMTPHAGPRSAYFNIASMQCIIGKASLMAPFAAFVLANRFVTELRSLVAFGWLGLGVERALPHTID